MEALAAVRGRGLVWEMVNVFVILDTLDTCARTVLMVTTEKKPLMTVQEPVQVPQIGFYLYERFKGSKLTV